MENENKIETPKQEGGISTMAGILITLLVAIIAGAGVWGYYQYKIIPDMDKGFESSNASNCDIIKDELVAVKFKLAIREFWGIEAIDIFQDPTNKNKFYYIFEDSGERGVYLYDLSKDQDYEKTGEFNIPGERETFFSETPVAGEGLRGAGITDNKFVFFKSPQDNSPGPCYTPWLDEKNLLYIDLTVKPDPNNITSLEAKKFTLSNDLKNSKEKEQQECLKEFK